jgi:2-polyprenyl-3-methyl-5-hydroxy-6-metoxy-1,4-benzoquinol methylase
METSLLPTESITQDRDDFVNTLFNSAVAAFQIFSVYIGDQLGYYQELAKSDGLTVAELSSRTNTQERYTREWLEQQASACILTVNGNTNDPEKRHFHLSPAKAEVLVDRNSLNYMAPMAQLVVGSVYPLESLLDVYRKGGGVEFSQYGVNLREGQAKMNRPMFLAQLGSEWLPAIPDVHARLQASPPARVADIGCGAGWSCIGLARSYPNVRVDGFDLDAASVDLANQNIEEANLRDRVSVQLRDASDADLHGRYDLVTAFECLHDMTNPVGALRTMRNLAGDHGAVIVVDERSSPDFQPCSETLEQLLYGFSILHCLPVGMVDQPSAGTGTVMRPSTVERYAQEAGFSRVEILPIDHFFFRFYRLVS